MELMTLRTMCERLNVSRRSIQCYEQAGLLKPSAKNKYGHLLYDEQAFQRAQMIRFLQQLVEFTENSKIVISFQIQVIHLLSLFQKNHLLIFLY